MAFTTHSQADPTMSAADITRTPDLVQQLDQLSQNAPGVGFCVYVRDRDGDEAMVPNEPWSIPSSEAGNLLECASLSESAKQDHFETVSVLMDPTAKILTRPADLTELTMYAARLLDYIENTVFLIG